MIVATPPGGARFYSNDGQLFCDGEVTIYSPRWLPEDTVLTSTEVGVWMAKTATGVAVTVVDVSSGHVFVERDGLTINEAGELAMTAFEQYAAEKET
jgi:hypothetical protein